MYIFSAILLAISLSVYIIVRRKNIIEWMVCFCAEAEMTYGSGTGYLKLRDVYAEFVREYPILSTFLPFSAFSALVDRALKILKEKLAENKAINDIVVG